MIRYRYLLLIIVASTAVYLARNMFVALPIERAGDVYVEDKYAHDECADDEYVDEKKNFHISGRQCNETATSWVHLKRYKPPQSFHFTPSREWPKTKDDVRTVLPMVISYGIRQSGMDFELWHKNLLAPHNITCVFLIDTHYNDLTKDMIIESHGLEIVTKPINGFTVLNITQSGPTGAIETLQLYSKTLDRLPGMTSYLYVGNTELDTPLWIKDQNKTNSDFATHWISPFCSPRGTVYYINACDWSVHNMFSMDIMQYFDFFLRTDMDITITKPMSNIGLELWDEHKWFMHTSLQRYNPSFHCDGNLKEFFEAYLGYESANCGFTVLPSLGDSWPTDDRFFYSNFIAGWIGLFRSQEVLHFGWHWLHYANGRYVYRWGDQEYWLKVIELSVSEFDKYVIDHTNWRKDGIFIHRAGIGEKQEAYRNNSLVND